MFTIVGGNPFIMNTGTTTFTGLRVVGTTKGWEEAKKIVADSYNECAGLIMILYNGEELQYNTEGEPICPL